MLRRNGNVTTTFRQSLDHYHCPTNGLPSPPGRVRYSHQRYSHKLRFAGLTICAWQRPEVNALHYREDRNGLKFGGSKPLWKFMTVSRPL